MAQDTSLVLSSPTRPEDEEVTGVQRMVGKEKEGGLKMKFKTQVCTTKEQSECLLALGLKKETADCHHWYAEGKWYTYLGEPTEFNCIPAWSLHRLMYMIDDDVEFGDFKDRAYDDVIKQIEEGIKQRRFDKEYLEDQP